ncbi:MAG: pitrilysin family protein [Patescibacteria group bacterium]
MYIVIIMNFKKKVLKNGLRIVVVPIKNSPSVTVMSLIEAGSKYETKELNGLSHFLEHMCFKGTDKRPKAIDISREFDAMGAQNNAFTSQEFTGYWGKAHPKNTDKLIDLISDMYLHPTLPADDLEREKGVIIEELNMYEDLPNRIVHDVWNELLYGDQPAGWSIIGTRENIRSFNRDDFVNYRSKLYVADATAVLVAGDVDANDIFKKIEKAFTGMPVGKKKGKKKVVESQNKPAVKIKYKDTDQTHLVMGFRAFDVYDKRTPALKLASTILGGGMSSRLFQKMREQLGICYYAKSFVDQLTDHGVLMATAGVDSSRVELGINGILEEFKKIRDEKVGNDELRKAKDYLIGNLYLGLESSDSLTEFYGMQEILHEKIKTPKEIEKEIEKVSAADIAKITKTIIQNKNLNMAIVGKYNDPKRFEKILKV